MIKTYCYGGENNIYLKYIESAIKATEVGSQLKINIVKSDEIGETEINVYYSELDAETLEVISYLNRINKKIAGTLDGETVFIPLCDVLYFEAVDGRVFGYTKEKCYQISEKLYRLEESLGEDIFVRISKSTIVNLTRLQKIKPEKNSRLLATLDNGERLVVSRQYIGKIREKLEV